MILCIPHIDPLRFQQNVTANPLLIIDRKINEMEVIFDVSLMFNNDSVHNYLHIFLLPPIFSQPPQLCDFQSASYVMSFTSGSETWSRDPVVIVDTSQQVKEDIETGFTLNRNYTVTITVFMDHTNVTSSANFSMFCVYSHGIAVIIYVAFIYQQVLCLQQ